MFTFKGEKEDGGIALFKGEEEDGEIVFCEKTMFYWQVV